MKAKISLLIILLTVSYSFTSVFGQDAATIINKMLQANKQINGLKFTIYMEERMKNKTYKQIAHIKINRTPLKFYYTQDWGSKIEALWVEGKNSGKALVNPKAFPYVNMNLDPYGNLMREQQHHVLFDADFNYTLKILDYLLSKYKNSTDKMVSYKGLININKTDCYILQLDNPNFKIINYTIKKGETLTSIAQKNMVSDYMILMLNPSISSYTDVKAGQTIKIPNDYARKMEIYIDKNRFIPISMRVYDESGLYERFDFSNVVLNPVFANDEFNQTFKEYDF